MGKLILDKATTALRDAGFPVERGLPAEAIPAITEPVCAVNLKQANLREQTATVLVTVLSPMELGAVVCEEAALDAAQILSELGGKCTVDACTSLGKVDMFCAEITGRFFTSIPKVVLNEQLLQSVTAFTCWRTVDEEITDLNHAPWCFRLEEFFPLGVEEEPEPEESFLLLHISEQGSKTFTNCTWTYQRRVWSADGTRQIRLGQAESMQDG